MSKKKHRKTTALIIGIILVAAASFLALYNRDMLAENPFETVRTFDSPSHAVTASDGTLLLIDNSKSRVVILRDGEIDGVIVGMRDGGGFFYAEHMASDGNNIYVSDVKYEEGSTRVETERILQFSASGRFEKILFERMPGEDEASFQHGKIMDMRFHGDALTFLYDGGDALLLYGAADGEVSLIRSISLENAADLCGAFYDTVSGQIYAVGKSGAIYGENAGGLSALDNAFGAGVIPWNIAAHGSGMLYITDLMAKSIIHGDGSLFFSAEGIIYRLDINEDGIISFTDGESVYQLTAKGEVLLAEAEAAYRAAYFLRRMLVWLAAVAAGAGFVYLATRLCLWLLKSGGSAETKYLSVISIATVLTSAIVSVSIFTSSLQNEARDKEFSITQIAQTVSNTSGPLFGDDFETLTDLGDYGSPAFERIHAVLDPICENAHAQGGHLYFVLYRLIDGMACAVVDYERTVGVVHPIGEAPAEWLEVFAGSEPYLFESYSDVNGSWTYAVAPIHSSRGDIIGVIEMGYNLDAARLRTQRQVQDVALSTAVLLIIFLLMFSEVSAIIEPVSELRGRKNRMGHIAEFIRPLMFLAFMTDSVGTVFIPSLSARMFGDAGLGFSLTIGAALPMSAKMFFIALASLAGGGALIRRLGMKQSLYWGIAAEAGGLMLTAAAVFLNNYALLIIGQALAGCGLGLAVVIGNTLPTAYEEERRDSLFAGTNVGMLAGIVVGTSIGSYVAQAAGYAATFMFSAALLLPALWLAGKCTPRHFVPAFQKTESPGNRAETISLKGFLSDRSVFSFLLFMMFPFMVIMYFRDFVFPLYAGEQAYSEVGIGQTLLFSGALGIFMAKPVSAALLKRLRGKRTNIISGLMCVGGLLLFALSPSLRNATIAVWLISFAACFGFVAQNVYFSAIRAVGIYGADKSMGVYSLFENLAQTLGPLLFGAALMLGYSTSALAVGMASAGMILLFAVLGRGNAPQGE